MEQYVWEYGPAAALLVGMLLVRRRQEGQIRGLEREKRDMLRRHFALHRLIQTAVFLGGLALALNVTEKRSAQELAALFGAAFVVLALHATAGHALVKRKLREMDFPPEFVRIYAGDRIILGLLYAVLLFSALAYHAQGSPLYGS